MKTNVVLRVVSIALVCSGCVTVKSKLTDVNAEVNLKPHVGNYYFLPKGLIQIDGEPVYAGAALVDFKVTVKVVNVPDKRKRYFLRFSSNVFFDDDVSIKVNSKGLLETANLTSEDRTPAIIDKVTDTLIDIGKIAANGNPFADKDMLTDPATPLPFHVLFDPLDQHARDAAINDLERSHVTLSFADSFPPARSGKDTPSPKVAGDCPAPENASGLLYRPPTVVEMKISLNTKLVSTNLSNITMRVPDKNSLAVLDLSRSFLIKKKNNYALSDGDLIQLDHNRPSQALALVSIPASIARKVSEAIPSIISIQDKRATRVPPELAAQKAQLDAEAAVLNSKAALLKAQQPPPPGNPTADRLLTKEEVIAEADLSKHRVEEAKAKADEARARSHEANSKADEAASRAREAKTNADAADAKAKRDAL